MIATLLFSLWSGYVSAATAAEALASNTKNMIYLIESAYTNITYAELNLLYDSDLELVAISPADTRYRDNISVSAITSGRVIRVEYDQNNPIYLTNYTQMLLVRFNTDLMPDEAADALSVMADSYVETIYGDFTGSYLFTVTPILLGDINDDSLVDSSDSLLTLQHYNGQATLTDLQLLAADTNLDGRIDATDTMRITHYSVATITTFWSDYGGVTLPTAAHSSITSGAVYRIENIFGQKGINTPSGAATGTILEQINYNYRDTAQQYRVTHISAGAYEIAPVNASGKVLSVLGGRLCVETDTNATRQRWYFVSTTGGYFIINKANTSQCLTTNGIASAGWEISSGTASFGNVWGLYGVTTTVKNYFDNGMLTRWELSAAQMRTQINDYMAFAGDVYSDLFDLVIEYNTPALYPTSADNCTGYATTNALNSDCSTSGHTDCKSNRAMLATFKSTHTHSTTSLPILWTGHHTWEIQNGSKVYVEEGGFYDGDHTIMMLNIGDRALHDTFADNDRIEHTVVHEMAHEFGASDTYCIDETGTNCLPNCFNHGGKNIYSPYCAMSQQVDITISEDVFCSQCLEDINEYLDATY